MSFHRLFPDDLDFGFSFNPFGVFTNPFTQTAHNSDKNAESMTHESFSSTSVVNGTLVNHPTCVDVILKCQRKVTSVVCVV